MIFFSEGQDFNFGLGPPVIITAGNNKGCFQISIIADALVEPQEEVNLAINTATTNAEFGTITETTVFILADGGMYTQSLYGGIFCIDFLQFLLYYEGSLYHFHPLRTNKAKMLEFCDKFAFLSRAKFFLHEIRGTHIYSTIKF